MGLMDFLGGVARREIWRPGKHCHLYAEPQLGVKILKVL
jgi:hypothetical protein